MFKSVESHIKGLFVGRFVKVGGFHDEIIDASLKVNNDYGVYLEVVFKDSGAIPFYLDEDINLLSK